MNLSFDGISKSSVVARSVPHKNQEGWFNCAMSTEEDRIKNVTNRFRMGMDQVWIGIKSLLAEKGINVENLIVADSFPEDHNQIYVVVVTENRQVFEFYYDWLHKKESEGEIIEWKDLTNTPEAAYMDESVKVALQLVGKI